LLGPAAGRLGGLCERAAQEARAAARPGAKELTRRRRLVKRSGGARVCGRWRLGPTDSAAGAARLPASASEFGLRFVSRAHSAVCECVRAS